MIASNGLQVLSQSVSLNQIFGDNRLIRLANFITSDRTQEEVSAFAEQLYCPTEAKHLVETLNRGSFVALSENEQLTDFITPETSTRNSGYRLLRILLTDVCNLSCDYCKVMHNITTVTKRAASPEDLKHVIELFFNGSVPSTPKVIHISGGEPLIAWERVKQIIVLVESLKRAGERYFIALGTNGILINAERAKYLSHHNIKVIVSIDGQQDIHDILRKDHTGRGSFKQVDMGIRLLNSFGIELGLSMVIGKHNVCHLKREISTMLEEYRPVSIGVNYMKPPTKSQGDFPFLITPIDFVQATYDAFRVFRNTGLFFELVYRRVHPFVTRRFRYHDCGAAAGTTINIDARGNIGPCKSFLALNTLASGMTIEPANCCSMKPNILDSLQRRSPVYIDTCQGCKAIGICGNACAYESWVQSGNMMNCDKRACEYTRQFYQKFVDDLAEITAQVHGNRSFQEPTENDRQQVLGRITVNPDTLSSSIGHYTD